MKILNLEKLSKFVETINSTNRQGLFVVSDFDRTLTKAYVDGRYVTSLMGILRNSDYLDEDYKIRGQELFNYYSPKVEGPVSQREELVQEWWTKAYKLLKEKGLRKKYIEEIIKHPDLQLRDGVVDFFDWTEKNTIPVFIMSAGGLGTLSIELFLKFKKQLRENIHIISNNFLWSEEGVFLGVKEPMVHMFNKTGKLISDNPETNAFLGGRRYALILGDSIGDSKMADEISEVSLKIYINGNEDILKKEEKSLSEYFDIVLEANESYVEILKILGISLTDTGNN